MTAVHKKMHERTGQQQKKGKCTQSVSLVLAHEQKPSDRQECEANQEGPRRPKTARWRGGFDFRLVMNVHRGYLAFFGCWRLAIAQRH